jgi:L-glutamine-phosphate cytidylyltransferase
MKYIFLAAGKSSRIYEKIKKPKSLIKINNTFLLERLIINAKDSGAEEIYVVTGFQKEKISEALKKHKIKFIHNKRYQSKDMLYSIYLALKKIKGDLIISYTDITYEKKILKKLNNSKNNHILVPVLKNWKNVWKKRNKNIFEDGESLNFDKKSQKIIEIGKKIKKGSVPTHQFMGIIKIPDGERKKILKILKSKKIISKMQTTDFLNHLIFKKMIIKYVNFTGKWFEFDDIEDFNHYKNDNSKFY